MHYLVYHLSHTQAPLLDPAVLDPTEQAAYARRGERYLLERTLLRRELARLCGGVAEDIRFSYTEQGKPEYDRHPFNLSHSGDILCLAFHHRALGVDVERVRERAHLPTLAKRIMCEAQLAAWHERGCQVQEFYDCWCTAEAIIKLHGGSIWQAGEYPFLHRGNSIEPLFDNAPVIQLFTPAPGYAGAVAYEADSEPEGTR